MTTSGGKTQGSSSGRPPVILLITDPERPNPSLEDALRQAGVVLICADPEAAPGFLEASDWPGVQVAMPDLVLVLGPRSEQLAQGLSVRADGPAIIAHPTPPPPDALADFVAGALSQLRPGRRAHPQDPR
jgi:hypothetical protein